MKKLAKILITLLGAFSICGTTNGQTTYTGVFKTHSGNTDYHHLTRSNTVGAAVYVNQLSTGAIMRLSSGTNAANKNVKFTVEGNGFTGIGTNSPSSLLNVHGSSPRIEISNTTETLGGIVFNDSEAKSTQYAKILYSSANNDLYFHNNSSHPRMIIKSSGKIGIGTTAPSSQLQVSAEGDPSLIEGEANGSKLHGFQIWGTDQCMYMGVSTSKRVSYIQSVDAWTATSTLALNARGGSVAIGTTDAAGHKLAVAGSIIAESVYCKLQSNWPDFVFTENYDLKTLDEVEDFIKENKHLPGIPAAGEVEENGIDLGDMNALLLQKIEELTLYIIEQNKQIANMQTQINSIQK